MTNRWYDVGITRLIYEDVRTHEKTSKNSKVFNENVWVT